MGSEQSKPTKQPESPTKSQEKTINHDRFLNYQYVPGHEGGNHIELRVPISSEEEYRNWENHLKDCPTQHEFYFMPQQIHLKNQGLCGNSHYLEIQYENFPHILANQIANRSNFQSKKSDFKEPELWYLLYVLVSAVRDFHMKNKKVGDIRPSNIFINNQGQIKVATYLTFPSEKSNYEKALYDKEITYLAPEELKDLQLVKADPGCDSIAAESFSVGLTCLDTSILQNSDHLYTKNNMESELRRKKEALKQKNYSNDYFRIINDLCCLSPINRLSGLEVYEMLEPHREKIMDLKPFTFTTKTTSVPQNKIFLFPEQNPAVSTYRYSEVKQVKQVKQMKVSSNKKYSPVRFTYTSASSTLRNSERVEPVEIETNKNEGKNLYSTPVKSQRPQKQVEQRTATSPYLPSNHYAYSGSKHTYLNNPTGQSANKVANNGYTVTTSSYQRYESGYQPTGETVTKAQELKDFGKIDQQIAASRKMFPA